MLDLASMANLLAECAFTDAVCTMADERERLTFKFWTYGWTLTNECGIGSTERLNMAIRTSLQWTPGRRHAVDKDEEQGWALIERLRCWPQARPIGPILEVSQVPLRPSLPETLRVTYFL